MINYQMRTGRSMHIIGRTEWKLLKLLTNVCKMDIPYVHDVAPYMELFRKIIFP